jgi:transposase
MGPAFVRDAGLSVMLVSSWSQYGVGGHRQELSIVAVSTRTRFFGPVVPPDGRVSGLSVVWGWVLWSCCMSGVAGLDIGKKDLKACVRIPNPSGRRSRRQEIRTFATTTKGLLELRDWLVAEKVTLVVLEATGDYWRGAFYLLEDCLNVILVNAGHAKGLPGRKTDVSDAAWLCQMGECGLLRASFVPPEPIRQLRDLIRYRATLAAERTREAQRLEKELEDAGIKLSSVATDILGVSGRAMLAEMARARMRPKIPQLVEALTGNFGEHHAFLCRLHLERIDQLSAAILELSARIEEHMHPFARQLEHLVTIPGVGQATAEVIIAETGGDMSRFRTAGHLASWAGVCPGHHESAGKRKSGKTRHGNRWLGGALGTAAMAAARTQGKTYLGARYRRLVPRLGKKKAIVAVEHSILTAVWHMLTHDVDYHELGGDYFTRLDPDRALNRIIRQANALGFTVRFDPIQAA